MPAKILVVEDEKNIVKVVTYALQREGYRVEVAVTGAEALTKVRQGMPDLVLLDLMLPEIDGLEVCRQVRGDARTSGIPIIMLTAKSEEADRVIGLEMGADDYLTKPFSARELTARVKAVLRRAAGAGGAAEVWRCGALTADWGRRLVKLKEKPVKLTPKEFELLRTLAQSGGRVLSREALLERVWGYDRSLEIQTRTVDLHVSQLRQKLGSEGKRLVTATGVGYRFVLPEED
ncbi:MAG: DNA-binding response regulator [Candidatus Omnitrophica bacterium CG11_big_fil_rev_8_21_14_0_20_64_10]|nr:MAG: DNA-binding response regulator [Candidatus Omnitrophica bacterium CG11_big_fil_rev_8_21_14_0_20_64_10]